MTFWEPVRLIWKRGRFFEKSGRLSGNGESKFLNFFACYKVKLQILKHGEYAQNGRKKKVSS